MQLCRYLDLIGQDSVVLDDVCGGLNQLVIGGFVGLIARQHDGHVHY